MDADIDQGASDALNRGVVHAENGDSDKAIADYTEAIRLDPTLAQAYYSRGNAYVNRGALDKAVADFTGAIRLDPTDAKADWARAYAYKSLGDNDRAIADFTQTIRLLPGFAGGYFERGMAHLRNGDYTVAIPVFTKVIELNPDLPAAYNQRGNAPSGPPSMIWPLPITSRPSNWGPTSRSPISTAGSRTAETDEWMERAEELFGVNSLRRAHVRYGRCRQGPSRE